MLPILLFFTISISSFSKAENRNELFDLIRQAEKTQAIPDGLLRAVIDVESSFIPDAINHASTPGVAVTSHGLGQLTADTARHHCSIKQIETLYEPDVNIKCSAKVFSYQMRRFMGDVERAIAAYNAGTPCECIEGFYKKKLSKDYTVCRKGDGNLMECAGKPRFLNQQYVDKVIYRYRASLKL
jgi:soluble lytic murein transglycosylase-like protein